MSIEDIYDGDNLILKTRITNPDGTVKDMTGAAVSSVALFNGSSVTADSVTLTDAPNGEISSQYDAGNLGTGTWRVFTRAALSGSTQTFETRVTVLKSPF